MGVSMMTEASFLGELVPYKEMIFDLSTHTLIEKVMCLLLVPQNTLYPLGVIVAFCLNI